MKARCSAIADSDSLYTEVRALEARVRMLSDELDSLKSCESTGCDLEVMPHKVADAQNNTTDLVTSLHRDTLSLYDSICHAGNSALVQIIRHLGEAFGREVQNLQQIAHDTVCGAAKEARGLFANMFSAIDKWLGVIVERAAYTGALTRRRAYSSRNASWDAQAKAPSNLTSFLRVPRKELPTNAMPNLPAARNFCDRLGYGAFFTVVLVK